MCEIILEVFKQTFFNNTEDIVKLSSKMMKDSKGEKKNGVYIYNLNDIKNQPDISKFIELLTIRNNWVTLLKKDLDKEYVRNVDFIETLKKLNEKLKREENKNE